MSHAHDPSCSCCSAGLHAAQAAFGANLTRRSVLAGMSSIAVSAWAAGGTAKGAEKSATTKPAIAPADELVVQPVLTYDLPQRREQTSWRQWGGLMEQAHVDEEAARIERELRELAPTVRSVKFLPLLRVRTEAEAKAAGATKCDAMLVYPAGANDGVLSPLVVPGRPTVFFMRHRSGPVSLYYEIMHPRFLRKGSDAYKQPGVDVKDVVVDEYSELAWRLQALAGLRKTLGQRIVAIGAAGGWGEGHSLAPKIAREKWHLDIREVRYPEVGKRIDKTRADASAMREAKRQAEEYLRQPGVTLKTERDFVVNSFVLYRVFKDLMKDNDATAMTIQACMGTIMPLSKTTACLPLSLINDEGLMAFCESDFVVIPAGMLMHHITGLPIFLNDPTWPHDGIVTIAHCTAPRRMDGQNYEPVELHTHFESDYGASPKVAMREGQLTTNVIPDFGSKKFVAFTGKVVANPFMPICRSQTDITVDGDCAKLVEDMRGFHWLTVYGDCRRETAYALRHMGIEWQDISA
jgi:hypothetical protein